MLGSLNSLQSTSCVLFNPAIPAIEEDWDLRQKTPVYDPLLEVIMGIELAH